MKKQYLEWFGNPYAGWPLLFLSIVPIFLASSYFRDGLASYSWKETEGRLLSVTAHEKQVTEMEVNST